MKPNNYIVQTVVGLTYITESLSDAWGWAQVMIAKGYAPQVSIYSTIGGR